MAVRSEAVLYHRSLNLIIPFLIPEFRGFDEVDKFDLLDMGGGLRCHILCCFSTIYYFRKKIQNA